MSHGPVEDKHAKKMKAAAQFLGTMFEGYGFALMVFEHNTTDGRMNYVSNSQRQDMITAMKEFIANHEGRAVDGPTTKQ